MCVGSAWHGYQMAPDKAGPRLKSWMPAASAGDAKAQKTTMQAHSALRNLIAPPAGVRIGGRTTAELCQSARPHGPALDARQLVGRPPRAGSFFPQDLVHCLPAC